MNLIRYLLLPFSGLYYLGLKAHELLYKAKIYRSIEFDLPVIAVGNLSMGGTGKTPHTEYLISLLQKDYFPAVISRGYRRRTSGLKIAGDRDNAKTIGDEPEQMRRKFPGITIAVAENRALAIPTVLMEKPGTDVILLDDALQHRSVDAGLKILITAYQKPFTADFLLPVGDLREPRSAYKKSDIIIVSKCPENLTENQKMKFLDKIQLLPKQRLYFTTLKYGTPYSVFNSRETVQLTSGKKVILLTAIAHSQNLEQWLRKNCEVISHHQYFDHHYFTVPEIEKLKKEWEQAKMDDVVILTTEKDATRLLLHHDLIRDVPIYSLPVEVAFLDKEAEFAQKILNFVQEFKTDPHERPTGKD